MRSLRSRDEGQGAVSTAAATAVLAALWPGLRKALLAIGRWLLDTIADEGVKGLAIYMRQRVKVFAKRIARVKARRRRARFRIHWRVRWLTLRIARWRQAIRWLTSTAAAKLKGRVVGLAIDRATREIPEDAPDEIFSRWRRRQMR